MTFATSRRVLQIPSTWSNKDVSPHAIHNQNIKWCLQGSVKDASKPWTGRYPCWKDKEQKIKFLNYLQHIQQVILSTKEQKIS